MPPSRERSIRALARTVRKCRAVLQTAEELQEGEWPPAEERTEEQHSLSFAFLQARESLDRAAADLDAILGDDSAH